MMIEHHDYHEALQKFIASLLPTPTRGLEIGMAWGESAHAFLSSTDATLRSVDLGDDRGTEKWLKGEFGDRFTFLQMNSSDIASSVVDIFDWIYIDGDHSYEQCKSDIVQCLPLLEAGGVVAFDDYGTCEGVKRAVDEMGVVTQPIPNHPNGGRYYRRPVK